MLCKNIVNVKGCFAAFALLLCYSSMDGCNWNCELTQYILKKGMTASACFKETRYP